jgi:hypothetical protein
MKVQQSKDEQTTGDVLVRDVWKGRHQFHTCGPLTCMRVRGQQGPFFTFFSLFFGVVIHLSVVEPYFATKSYYMSTVLVVVLWLYALYVMLRAWLSDPGILPRKQLTYRQKKSSGYRQSPPNPQYVISSGRRVKLSYCSSCEMYQPPRTAHCIMSDSCVMRFDHFCPWIGNTVGQRNYRYFFKFLIVGLFLLLDIMCTCSARMYYHINPVDIDSDVNDFEFGVSIAILIFSVIFFCFIVGMVVFHTYLQATNQTTYENVNSRWAQGNPHGYGRDIFMQLMCALNRSKIPHDIPTSQLMLNR